MRRIKKLFWDYPVFLGRMTYAFFSVEDMVFIAVDTIHIKGTVAHIFKLERDRIAKERRDEMHLT